MKKKLLCIALSFALVVTLVSFEALEAPVEAKTKATVSTQSGLKKAVKNKKLKTLTIKTSKNKTFTIPKGNYKNTTIVVNSAKGKINISKKAKVSKVRIVKKNSNIKIKVAGELSKINVEKKSNLTISGTTKKNIEVNILKNADNTLVSSSVKVLVNAEPNADIELKKGAEDSIVKYNDVQQEVKVTNNTEGTVVLQDSAGEQIEISTTETFESSAYEKKKQEKAEKEKKEQDQAANGGHQQTDTSKGYKLEENETEWYDAY